MTDFLASATSSSVMCLMPGTYTGCADTTLQTSTGDPVILFGLGSMSDTVVNCSGSGTTFVTLLRPTTQIWRITIVNWGAVASGAIVVADDAYNVQLYNVKFDSLGSATDSHTAVHVGNSVNFELHGCVLRGCRASAVVVTGSSFIGLYDTLFEHNYVDGDGAAVSSLSGVIAIENCVFKHNTADDASIDSLGGAVMGTIPWVLNSVFANNWAYDGGDMEASNIGGTFVMKNCTFSDSYSVNSAGAIRLGATTATITSTTFAGCTSVDGGAMMVGTYEPPGAMLTNVTLVGCESTSSGGLVLGSDTVISSSYFVDNYGNTGVAIESSFGNDLTLRNVVFTANTGLQGTAVFFSSGGGNDLDVEGCHFEDNSAVDGVISFAAATVTVSDSDFVNNVASTSYGVVAIDSSSVLVSFDSVFVTGGVEGSFILASLGASSVGMVSNSSFESVYHDEGVVVMSGGAGVTMSNCSAVNTNSLALKYINGGICVCEGFYGSAAGLGIQANNLVGAIIRDVYVEDVNFGVDIHSNSATVDRFTALRASTPIYVDGSTINVTRVALIGCGSIVFFQTDVVFSAPIEIANSTASIFDIQEYSNAVIDGGGLVFRHLSAAKGGVVLWTPTPDGTLELANFTVDDYAVPGMGAILDAEATGLYALISNVYAVNGVGGSYTLRTAGSTDISNVTVIGRNGGFAGISLTSGTASTVRNVVFECTSAVVQILTSNVILENVSIGPVSSGAYMVVYVGGSSTASFYSLRLEAAPEFAGDGAFFCSTSSCIVHDADVLGFTNTRFAPLLVSGASSARLSRVRAEGCGGLSNGLASVVSSPDVAVYDSNFAHNSAPSDDGAFKISGTSTVNFTRTRFEDNTAVMGGVVSISDATATVRFIDSVLVGNSGSSIGSALMCLSQSTCELIRTKVLASRGATAIYLLFQSTLTATDSVVAGSDDDAIGAYGAGDVILLRTTLTGSAGTAININQSPLSMVDCVVSSNSGTDTVSLYSAFDVSLTGSYIGGNSGVGFSCIQQKAGYTTALADSVVCGNGGGDYNCDGNCNIAGDAPNACSAVNTTDCGGYCDSHDDFCVSGSGFFAGPYDTGCAECGGPCDTGNFTCPNYAVCVDGIAANYSCVCPTGFTGNGTVPCDDVDECSLGIDNCATIASCSNSVGSFNCYCPSGYWGTGVYCVDIDECAQANSTSCAAGANCANVPGSVTCECAAGTYGDGYTSCTSCPTNAGSTQGSFNLTDCSCNTGFFNLYGDASADCVPCPPGWAVSALGGDVYVCSQCPPDTYSVTLNAGECISCPPQSTTNGVAGSTNCSCVDDFAFNANTSRCETYCPPGTSRSDDAIACIDCAPGTYSDSPNADDCTVCPLNSLTTDSSSVSVANCTCVSGYAAPGGVVGVDCERWCPAGSYRPSPFSLDCPVCDIGSYSDEPNVGACTPCPNNAVTPAPNSTAITDCECPPNYYTPERERGTECRPCPSGAKCKGGVSWPVARKGYIYVEGDDGSAGFAECVPFEACAGNGQCAEGYTGDLCERCKPNYYRLDGLCYKCQNNAWLIVLACGLALFMFCAVLVWFNSQDRAINKFASVVIGVNALQIAGMYGRLNLNWPPLAQKFFAVLSLVNFNIELVSPECAVSVNDPFVLRWLLTMFFPVLVVAIFASIAGIGSLLMMAGCCGYDPAVSKWNPRYLRHTCIRAFYQLMTIGYLPLSAAVFEFFYCVKDASGVRVISTARQTVCYTSTYWGLFPVALLCLALYPVGVPLFCGFLLKTKRDRLGDFKFSLRYGFLVGRFTSEFYFFELAIMARKLGVALAMSFLTDNAYVKAAGAIVVLVASYSAQLRFTPYRTQLYNTLEDACLFCSILILLVSVVFQAGGTEEVTRAVCIVTLLVGLVFVIVGGLVVDAYLVLQLERSTQSIGERAVVTDDAEKSAEFYAVARVADSGGSTREESAGGSVSSGGVGVGGVSVSKNPAFE